MMGKTGLLLAHADEWVCSGKERLE